MKPLVIVTWNDAHGDSGSAFSEHEIPHAPIVIDSVGWLLREDDAGVTVAAEFCHDGTWRGVTFVPRGMIQAVRPATRARTRRKSPAPSPAAESDGSAA